VIVELDSYRFHRDRGTFESDRKRDAAMLAAGLQTVRITWERMIRTPEQEAELLRMILARRRPSLEDVTPRAVRHVRRLPRARRRSGATQS
jgi:very-short-patch-repair endonuclease